jgi:hypothetical protein
MTVDSDDVSSRLGDHNRSTLALDSALEVGAFRPNAWGLYDMHGNVMGWCLGWYAEHYYGKSPPADPAGPPQGTNRVVRGGNWLCSGRFSRSAFRGWYPPGYPSDDLGFGLPWSRPGNDERRSRSCLERRPERAAPSAAHCRRGSANPARGAARPGLRP